MRIVAYLYSDPLLETAPDPAIWGWELDQIYQDLAGPKSARDRPQWDALIQDCQSQPVDYLLVRRLEELGDRVDAVGERLAQLETRHVRLILVEQPAPVDSMPPSALSTLTPATPQADLIKLLQHLQTEQQSRKIRQGHARNRIQALPPPGKAPYGYKRGKEKYNLDRTTAPVVKDFFEQFLLYGSVRGAVRYLAQKYSKKISVSTGHRWLTNPVYRGDLTYQTGDTIRDTHAAIITRDEAAQVDRLLRRNRRLPPRSASAPRSLAGLVVCSACQSPQTVARIAGPSKDKEYLYLRPNACAQTPKCKAIPYETVLQSTIARICEELPQAVAAMTMPDIPGMKQGMDGAIAAKQGILDQLPELVTTGILDPETANLRAYKLKTEIATLQGQLAQLPPVNLQSVAQAVSIPQFWFDLSEAERRFYFREFLRHIELHRQGQDWQLKLAFIF
jgi:DNA invertase Pin-like site-specific DNA recombinase